MQSVDERPASVPYSVGGGGNICVSVGRHGVGVCWVVWSMKSLELALAACSELWAGCTCVVSESEGWVYMCTCVMSEGVYMCCK